MRDRKGVERGRCLECSQCAEFEFSSKDYTCNYCGCLGVKHENQEDFSAPRITNVFSNNVDTLLNETPHPFPSPGVTFEGISDEGAGKTWDHKTLQSMLFSFSKEREEHKRKKNMFAAISAELAKQGSNLTPAQIEAKVRSMTATYEKLKPTNGITARGKMWPFFKEFQMLDKTLPMTNSIYNPGPSLESTPVKTGQGMESSSSPPRWFKDFQEENERLLNNIFYELHKKQDENTKKIQELIDKLEERNRKKARMDYGN